MGQNGKQKSAGYGSLPRAYIDELYHLGIHYIVINDWPSEIHELLPDDIVDVGSLVYRLRQDGYKVGKYQPDPDKNPLFILETSEEPLEGMPF